MSHPQDRLDFLELTAWPPRPRSISFWMTWEAGLGFKTRKGPFLEGK